MTRSLRYLIAAGFFVAAFIAYYSPGFNLHEVYARWAFDGGVEYDKQGEIDKAIERYDTAIARYPQFTEAYNNRGKVRGRKHDLDGALADYGEVIRLRPDASFGYYNRALALREKGDTDAAIADLGEAARTGRAYLDRVEQNRTKIDNYIVASEQGMSDLIDIHMLRGRLLQQRGDYASAMADFTATTGIKQAGAQDSGTFELIRTQLLAGDHAAAGRDAEAFAQRSPDNAGALMLRGFVALFVANEPGRAGDDFANAAKKGLSYLGFRKLLGHVAPDSGEWFASGVPFRPYAYNTIVWQHLARERAGQDDREEMKATLETLGKETWGTGLRMITAPDGKTRLVHGLTPEAQDASRVPWPGRTIDLFLGTWTPEALRAEVVKATDKTSQRRRQCDADLYIGLFRLKSAPAEARTLLQAAADNCPPDALEGVAARLELGRLGS
jgi:tetratricopeptide (TPR) repeat protein